MLLEHLGNKCAECGSADELEIDHINGRDWHPCQLDIMQRLRRYFAEAREGKLRVLCADCNARLGSGFRYRGARSKRAPDSNRQRSRRGRSAAA